MVKAKYRNSKRLETANSEKTKGVFHLGGKDSERLYLSGLQFKMADGRKVKVSKTAILGTDREDLVARSKARYALLALFCRLGFRILDFPCGSGYAADLLKDFKIKYEGMEIDEKTVEFAKLKYGNANALFKKGNLRSPKLTFEHYDTIGCIEGLEHIEKEYQMPLIAALFKALKPGGTLIVSSPENTTGISGISKENPYHKWELNKVDFLALLYTQFQPNEVELITHKASLSCSSKLVTCFFGICHKNYGKKE